MFKTSRDTFEFDWLELGGRHSVRNFEIISLAAY